MDQYPPADLLKAAIFESALPKDARSQLGQDFLQYVNKQNDYPKNDDDLKQVYKDFTAHTLAETALPADHSGSENHAAKMNEYMKPSTPVLAHLNLALSGMIGDEAKARRLQKMSTAGLLSSNLIERGNFEATLISDFNSIPSTNRDNWKENAAKIKLQVEKEFQGEPILKSHLENKHMQENHEFLDGVLNLDNLQGRAKLDAMNTIYDRFIAADVESSINIEGQTRQKIADKLDSLNRNVFFLSDEPGNTEAELNILLLQNSAVFDAAAEHITGLLKKEAGFTAGHVLRTEQGVRSA